MSRIKRAVAWWKSVIQIGCNPVAPGVSMGVYLSCVEEKCNRHMRYDIPAHEQMSPSRIKEEKDP